MPSAFQKLLVLDDQLIYLQSSEVSNFFTNVAHLGHLGNCDIPKCETEALVEMSKKNMHALLWFA